MHTSLTLNPSSSATSSLRVPSRRVPQPLRRPRYRCEVELLSARTSLADFRNSFASQFTTATCTTSRTTSSASTTFSGIGATTGRALHILGGKALHGIEYLAKIRPLLKRHRDALEGKTGTTLSNDEKEQIVRDLLEISKAEYLRSYRKQALEILILVGGREMWMNLDKASRRHIQEELLEICSHSRLSNDDVEFAQGHLETCILWDMQRASECHDLSDVQYIANEIRKHATKSHKAWAYEILHDILHRSHLDQTYTMDQRRRICTELLGMSIQGRGVAKMDWAVECLSTFLRLHDWDECLGKEEVERMCSSLYTLAKKEDSKSGKTRSWALYHLWIFVGLPSCQRAERAVFPPERWREIILDMLDYARAALPNYQKQAFETLVEFLELPVVGDPLQKAEKQQICKELLSYSRGATAKKDKRWAFELVMDLMRLETWSHLTVKVQRVPNKGRSSIDSYKTPYGFSSPQLINRRNTTGVTSPSGSRHLQSLEDSTEGSKSTLIEDDIIDIAPVGRYKGSTNKTESQLSDTTLKCGPLMSVTIPIRLYACSWDDPGMDDLEMEEIDPEEVIDPFVFPTQRLPTRTTHVSPVPPRVSLHLPDVILDTPFPEMSLRLRDSQSIRQRPLSLAVSSLDSLSQTLVSSPELPVSSLAGNASRRSTISCASNSNHAILTTTITESPLSLGITQNLPPASPSHQSASPSLGMLGPSTPSTHTRYRNPPSPVPTRPLPQIPPLYQRGISLDSVPLPRRPPRSPVLLLPERTFTDPCITSSGQMGLVESPQKSHIPRRTVNRQSLQPIAETVRSRPRDYSFLEI